GAGKLEHHGHATNEHGEAPRSMMWPVLVLGVLTVVGGLLAIPGLWNVPHDFLHAAHAAPTREVVAAAEFSTPAMWLLALAVSLPIAVIGIACAWMTWGSGSWAQLRTKFPALE